jgi:hypothetical protein
LDQPFLEMTQNANQSIRPGTIYLCSTLKELSANAFQTCLSIEAIALVAYMKIAKIPFELKYVFEDDYSPSGTASLL